MNVEFRFKKVLNQIKKLNASQRGSFAEYLVFNYYNKNYLLGNGTKPKYCRHEGIQADIRMDNKIIDVKSRCLQKIKNSSGKYRIIDINSTQYLIPSYSLSNRVNDIEYERLFFFKDKVVLVNDFKKAEKPKYLKTWSYDEVEQEMKKWSQKKRTSNIPKIKMETFRDKQKKNIFNWYLKKSGNELKVIYRGPHNSSWADAAYNSYPTKDQIKSKKLTVYFQGILFNQKIMIDFIFAFPHNKGNLKNILWRTPSKHVQKQGIKRVFDLKNMICEEEKYAKYFFKDFEQLKSQIFKRFSELK